eukprot:5046142-Pyramimonas_sp.AAC.1
MCRGPSSNHLGEVALARIRSRRTAYVRSVGTGNTISMGTSAAPSAQRGVGRWRKSRGHVQGPSLDDELERLAGLFPERAEARRGARGQLPHAPGPEPVASSDNELDRKVAKQRTALAMAVERDSKAERLALHEVEQRLPA